MHYKKLLIIISVCALTLGLCGCTKASSSIDDMFTDRDYDTSYSASKAEMVTLSGSKNYEITKEGTYILSGSLTNAQIVINTDDTEKVQLVLDGVNITNTSTCAIYVKQCDKVFVTLAKDSKNTLKTTSNYVAIDDNNIDGVIWAKSDITFNGEGTLSVIGSAEGHGIVSKDDIKITSGTYNITGAKHALQGKDSVRIGGGTINLTAGEDAVHSENEEKADDGKGFIYMCDGEVNISAGDDGMHGGVYARINGGKIVINKCYEGIEAQKIYIDKGNIKITSSDDGLNAASGETTNSNDPMASDDNCELEINGGKLYISAEGDGIDSNGTLTVTGGKICVDGPVSGGNGPLDYGSSAKITGGTIVAVGSSDMAENFTEAEGQGVFMISASGKAGDKIVVKNSDGDEIFSYTPSKSYQCILISTPKIKKGKTYTVTYGSNTTSVEMSKLIVSTVTGGIGGGGQGAMGGNPGGMGGDPGAQGGNGNPGAQGGGPAKP